MLVKHHMYVAEKTQFEYMQAVRRSCAEQSLPERLIGRVLNSLRQALARVEFAEDRQPVQMIAQPGSDDPLRG